MGNNALCCSSTISVLKSIISVYGVAHTSIQFKTKLLFFLYLSALFATRAAHVAHVYTRHGPMCIGSIRRKVGGQGQVPLKIVRVPNFQRFFPEEDSPKSHVRQGHCCELVLEKISDG